MFLYHLKPPNMIGNVLYPLNQLKNINEDAYEYGISKYSFRKDLMDVNVPIANCKWNDVIHLCPVDISIIVDQMFNIFKENNKVEVLDYEHFNNRYYYVIPSEMLDTKMLYIYLKYDHLDDSSLVQNDMNKNVFKWDDTKNKLSSEITKGQIDYFKLCAEDLNKLRYLFTAIPHVFYKGSINVKESEVKKVSIDY